MDYPSSPKNNNVRKPNPAAKANLFSKITFYHTLALFKTGFQKKLQRQDIYQVLPNYESNKLGDEIEQQWDKRKKEGKSSSTYHLLWHCYGRRYFLLGLTQFFILALSVIRPITVGKFLSYFNTGQTEIGKTEAYLYGILLSALHLIESTYKHNYDLQVAGLAIRCRTGICALLYRKALKLSSSRLRDISIGKISTIISKDANSFETFVVLSNDVWIGVIKVIIVCYLLYQRIGITVSIVITTIVLILIIQVIAGKAAVGLRMKAAKNTDQRLQLTQETLSAIRTIKMSNWESFFIRSVSKARLVEVTTLFKTFILHYGMLSLIILNHNVTSYLVLMTHVWFGNSITSETVYLVLNFFQTMYFTFYVVFPYAIVYATKVIAAIRRIHEVLQAMDQKEFCTIQEKPTKEPKIILRDASVLIKNKTILSVPQLTLEKGITVLIGPLGSGKSTLLRTILGDFKLCSGRVLVDGRISYAAQEPWLFPGTLKKNIVFGEEFNWLRYKKVLEVCDLNQDLNGLENTDRTIVSDKGINLSKGQQSRVNLARALYKESEIYLLDDCFSPLDTLVSHKIFNKITEFLKDKLVVLVTQNEKFHKRANVIITIDKGRIEKITLNDEIQIMEPTEGEEEGFNNKHVSQSVTEENHFGEDSKLLEPRTEIFDEEKQSGGVSRKVYQDYIKYGGGYFGMFLIIFAFCITQLGTSYKDKLISDWVSINERLSNSSEKEELAIVNNGFLYQYSGAIVVISVSVLLRALVLLVFVRRTSIRLHKLMLNRVVNATMKFFDVNFRGNILNRFSKDLAIIDENIPLIINHIAAILFETVGVIILVGTVSPMFLFAGIMLLVSLYLLKNCYLKIGIDLKRLETSMHSPVVGHINSLLEGLTTVRAFKAEAILLKEFERHQDLYSSASFMHINHMRAFLWTGDMLCGLFAAVVILKFIIFEDDTPAGEVGLAISQTLTMTSVILWGIYQWADLQTQITSVERVLEYVAVEQETRPGKEVENWPNKATVKFENVGISYTNSQNYELKNVNFAVKSREKIGIVGRTGAGKSSVISALFQLYNFEGSVIIDDVDLKSLSLPFLRSRIGVIPQEPLIFTGTLRQNLDPLGLKNDEEIWRAVEAVNLKKLVNSLDDKIGDNMSVGEKQLFGLARVLLQRTRIVVLDEAIEHVDPEASMILQNTIRKMSERCTVFIIAHKLQLVMECDRVMVLKNGQIVEFDHPQALLKNKNGVFYKMTKHS